ncbi:MAG: PTS sugar transporter subunit IIB [Kurthia gibsonii]|uniref:PTS sugar transporter subunit IIB n=1 Tax=Kurthia gibsonii TaxID=33946 RepID=A0ABU9LHP2_9BACL|nr:PTS sugar transporter subunit IIB [Kurthia gibsonii]
MKTIMLVCVAGMSTSLLVTKMQKAAQAQNMEADIFAIAENEVEKTMENKSIDVLLLGPQVRYLKSSFDKKLAGTGIPLDVISMSDYGMMNGENVLNQALHLMK